MVLLSGLIVVAISYPVDTVPMSPLLWLHRDPAFVVVAYIWRWRPWRGYPPGVSWGMRPAAPCGLAPVCQQPHGPYGCRLTWFASTSSWVNTYRTSLLALRVSDLDLHAVRSLSARKRVHPVEERHCDVLASLVGPDEIVVVFRRVKTRRPMRETRARQMQEPTSEHSLLFSAQYLHSVTI